MQTAVKMWDMRASIFGIGEAKKRIGIRSEDEDPERLIRGRDDGKEFLVTSSMFTADLSPSVPVQGTIQLGIARPCMSDLVKAWEKKKRPVVCHGEFIVNNHHVHGELVIDFSKETATLTYMSESGEGRSAAVAA
jgi:hypothetical protein